LDSQFLACLCSAAGVAYKACGMEFVGQLV